MTHRLLAACTRLQRFWHLLKHFFTAPKWYFRRELLLILAVKLLLLRILWLYCFSQPLTKVDQIEYMNTLFIKPSIGAAL